jgi:hypothetical protein
MDAGFDWIAQHGYAAIFLLLMLGIVGLPLPDEALLMFVGYLTLKGELAWGPSLGGILWNSMRHQPQLCCWAVCGTAGHPTATGRAAHDSGSGDDRAAVGAAMGNIRLADDLFCPRHQARRCLHRRHLQAFLWSLCAIRVRRSLAMVGELYCTGHGRGTGTP